jgi:hypothetical protein
MISKEVILRAQWRIHSHDRQKSMSLLKDHSEQQVEDEPSAKACLYECFLQDLNSQLLQASAEAAQNIVWLKYCYICCRTKEFIERAVVGRSV